MDVTLYSSPTCGYCHQAERFLKERGVKFTKYDISMDRAAANSVLQLTGQMAVPVITIDNEVVVGFDRPRLERLLSRGNGKTRPAFGLRVVDADRRAHQYGAHASGAYVDKVAPGYPGDRAGLREGDIITHINSRPIRTSVDLAEVLASLSGGSEVTIGLRRGDKPLVAQVAI